VPETGKPEFEGSTPVVACFTGWRAEQSDCVIGGAERPRASHTWTGSLPFAGHARMPIQATMTAMTAPSVATTTPIHARKAMVLFTRYI
jgi:hypothetical protein